MKLNYAAGLASCLIVGLGQILKGQSKKGLKMLLFFYFALPAITYGSLASLGNSFILVLSLVIVSAIILWAYSLADALRR